MGTRALAVSVILCALLVSCGDSGPSEPRVGPPANLLILTGGTPQAAIAGQPTPVAPSVLITDANNQPVPDVTVTFAIASGGGSVSSPTVQTSSTGVAVVTWTLGNTFGPKTLTARSGALGPVTFNATAMAPDGGVSAFNLQDAAGDTLPYLGPDTTRAHDLLAMQGDFKRDSVIITLTFARSVTPSLLRDNWVAGIVEIDIDDDPATGRPAVTNNFGANSNLGVEYLISIFGTTGGSADLLVGNNSAVELLSTFSGNTVTIRIPMSLLGNDDGNFGIVAVIGTVDRPTDSAPNSGAVAVRRSFVAGLGRFRGEIERPASHPGGRPRWFEDYRVPINEAR